MRDDAIGPALGALVGSVGAATVPEDCTAAFRDFLAGFELDAFCCGELDWRIRQRSVMNVVEWPMSWFSRYVETGLIENDPLLALLEKTGAAVTWDMIRARPNRGRHEKLLFDLAENFGWTQGFAIPIPRGGSRIGIVSLCGDRGAFSEVEIATLALASVFYYERFRGLNAGRAFPLPPSGLTPREIASLDLVARGATDRRIAAKLGISQATAHDHVENAKRKLVVKTRAEAIAVAVSLGIVTG
jgi:DNA-binding CsgD family transcriptional regulator